jgi:dynein heavy chain
VVVDSYDPVSHMYHGLTDDTVQSEFVAPKLFLKFDAENPHVFAKRLTEALKLRDKSENIIKYNFYISKIAFHGNMGLPKEREQKILDGIRTDVSLVTEVLEKEIEMIHYSYATCLNKMMFDDLYFNKQTAELCCGNLKIKRDPTKAAPLYAKEKLPDYDYQQTVKEFNLKNLRCKDYTIDILHKVKQLMTKAVDTLPIFKLDIDKTMRVDDFKKEQRQQMRAFRGTIDNMLKSEIKGYLDVIKHKPFEGNGFQIDFITNRQEKKRLVVFAEDEKKEKYMELVMSKINEVKTNNFLTIMNNVVKDSLFSLACKSVISYINFLEQYIPPSVKVENTNHVDNEFSDSYYTRMRNISQSSVNLEEDSAYRVKTSEPDIDLNTTLDIIEENNVTIPTIDKFPLFHIFVKYRDGKFEYNYSVELLIEDLMRLFDEGLDKLYRIPLINPNEDESNYRKGYFDILSRSKNPRYQGNVQSATEHKQFNEDEVWAQSLYERLEQSLKLGLKPLDEYLTKFSPYKDYLNIVPEQYLKKFDEEEEEGSGVNKLKSDIIKLNKLRDKILNEIEEEIPVSYFLVNCKEIRENLIKLFEKVIELMIQKLQSKAKELKVNVTKRCEEIKRDILKSSKNIEELVAVEKYIDDVPSQLQQVNEEITSCMDIFNILDDFQINMQFLEFKSRWMLVNGPTDIINTISSVKTSLQKQRDRFDDELKENKNKLKDDCTNLEKNLKILTAYNNIMSQPEASTLAKALESIFQDCKEKSKLYNTRESLFNVNITDYSRLTDMYKEFEPFYHVWTYIDIFLNKSTQYLSQDIFTLDGNEVIEMNNNVLKYLSVGIKKLKERESDFGKLVETTDDIYKQAVKFKPIANLAKCLTTPGMEERHWLELKELTGIDCLNKEGITLEKIMENHNIDSSVLQAAQLIADKASRENAICLKLNYLDERWKSVNFELLPFRTPGNNQVGGWGDIYTALDEDVMEVQQLEANQFKGPYLNTIAEWSQSLLNISNILETWQRLQQIWMKLQPIFESPDILKSIPAEAKRFNEANTSWKDLVKFLKENLNVKHVCAREGIYEKIKIAFATLETVEKGLNEYTEKKKSKFPRFYFISHEDLIQIISQTKDFTKINENLKNIFESIHDIEFSKDNKNIVKMISGLRETVPLNQSVLIHGRNVEDWMLDLERIMFETVRSCLERAIRQYPLTAKEKWVFDHPGQCVLHANQVYWTSQVEEAIANRDVLSYIESIQDRIDGLVKIVRGNLTRVNGITISNLITMEVHNKEVTESLVKNDIRDVFSFEWIKQLRYSWERPPEKTEYGCVVKSIQTTFPYGYEYLGNTEILVITPLTDKCYLTLMGALRLNMGGAPAGPAGTGKTESTKDLAKALAKQCIVYNCSDKVEYDLVAKFFKGLACCGAWICFDEFNRINVEVLSVIATQLIQLFNAKADGETELNFQGSQIRILPTFCVFVTMNPDYEGRSALPDNLKALFRPMAMMVPNYELISQVYLYSSGYLMAKELATKIVSTFKLSSEQLSSQFHYDFGMRSVKSVLYASKKLKRTFGDSLTEDKLLLRALEDVNVPKFLKEDIPLFKNIIKDLFPTTQKPQSDLGDLIDRIKHNCVDFNLQPAECFLNKVIQLYDTIQVRHGLMLVGPAGGGKSKTWNILKKSLSDLNDGIRYFKTESVVVNPKSITKDQLFCEFDKNTNEYNNGIIPINIMKINQANKHDIRNWIVFDGPVDTLWIEDLNSVLDDSKKLCLSSSAIIQLSETITMMFEVEDLTHASPATVSRCGMVFIEPSALGLLPIVDSWVNTIPKTLKKDNFIDRLKKLFYKHLDDSIRFIRKQKEPCPSTNNSLLHSLLRLLECFFDDYNEKPDNKVSDLDIDILFQSLPQVYLYATIWSIGITVDENGRAAFSKYIRDQLKEYEDDPNIVLPEEGDVYEYSFDVKNGNWNKWETFLSYPSIDSKSAYTDIIIPTIDSIRYCYFIKLLVVNTKHVITTGPTGTGKTVNVMDVLTRKLGEKYMSLVLNFSAQTRANQTQAAIDGKVSKAARGKFKPDKPMVIFIDDMNMPKKETYEAQPPIEILRQWLDYEGWYDQVDKEKPFRTIINIQFVGAMGPPGGGRAFLSNRFMRHFNLVTYTELVDSSIKSIFTRKVNHFVGRFPEEIKDLIPTLVNSTLTAYKLIKAELLPTPKNSHYLFNLRDMSKTLQGVCSASVKHTVGKIDLVRLWIHEVSRAFGDRLTTDKDRQFLQELMNNEITKEFGLELPVVYGGGEKIIFADFMLGADRPYVMVNNMKQFITKIEDHLRAFNDEPKNKPMRLVMFLDACDHVARICRIIRQTQGHALLLGVGGSGRQSLAKLASYINGYDCIQIEVTKSYNMTEFKRNLKDILKICGLKEKDTTFLICDTQIFDELVLEDINNCLNSGDVPDIYKLDDMEEIKAECRHECARRNLPETATNIFNIYLNRVRTHLHVIMAMSPMGAEFNTRLRMFPSLVNCCTIDWFTEWPEEALRSVAKDKLEAEDLDLGESFNGCIDSIKYIHKSVEEISKDFLNELRRYNYLTPTSFLEFLTLFKSILIKKREENISEIQRLEVGLNVLFVAGEKIQIIEKSINENMPILKQKNIEIEEAIKLLKIKTQEAEDVREKATVKRAEADELNREITEIYEMCERELDSAQKELEKSLTKIDQITPNDLKIVGNVSTYSEKLQKVVEMMLIFKTGEGYKRRENMEQTGDLKNPWRVNYITAASNDLCVRNSTEFLAYFKEFKEDSRREKLKNEELNKVKLTQEFIKVNNIDKNMVSFAAQSILGCYEFILAMIQYTYTALEVVDPLKIKAQAASIKKAEADQMLAEADAQYNAAITESTRLEKEYNDNLKEKNDLAFRIAEDQTKVERAKELVRLLAGEKDRWGERVVQLKSSAINITGDCLLAAAMIAYSGAFTSTFRVKLEELWRKKIDEEGIARNRNVSLRSVMEDPIQTRKWNSHLLPNDNLSIENGIIMFATRRWPLMIDPQNQASIFIKKYGFVTRESAFQSIKISDSKMMDQVITGVKFGFWILLDNVGLSLDSSLEPILQQQFVRKGAFCEIKIGEKTIPYHDNFKLFMITTISNPHYSPETFAKVTMINFAITQEGLEDQMLSELVKIEMPELEESKNRILEENFASKEALIKLEDRILDNLNKNKDNIEETLKSSDLIDILTIAKTKSKEINERMVQSEITGKEIEEKRQIYHPSAVRAALLFFALLDISNIDPMYQYSLIHFKKLFEKTVSNLEPVEDIQLRIEKINRVFTKEFFDYICRSLFEKDKILFSFLMTTRVIMGEHPGSKITPMELRFLLAGPSSDLEVVYPENPTSWISNNDWKNFYSQMVGMGRVSPNLAGLDKFFMENHKEFEPFYESNKNEFFPLPGDLEEKLNEFQKLILIKALRFDKLVNSLILFVEKNIGKEFTEPPSFDLRKSYNESDFRTPLLFILSTGSDPINDLKMLAEANGRKIEYVSLGKNMDRTAIAKIDDCKLKGQWVILQNCHLAISFLSRLEDIIENLQHNNTVDPNFRMWLTSMSTDKFSINVLKSSIKITMEPPTGLKLNLQRQYNTIKNDDFEGCTKPELFKTFFFSLCFFHAIVQDRRKFGPIGWNVKYDFTNEDLIVSRKQLKNFLEEYEDVPYKVLNYLGAEINYGGRVTDDKDQRLIRTILASYMTPDVLKFEDYTFSESGIYFCPTPGDKDSYIRYIDKLPNITSPEVFGLHDNAEISTAQNEAKLLLDTVLQMQPRTSTGAGKSADDVIKETLEIVRVNTPELFDYEAVYAKYPTEYTESMHTVLIQEVIRYNVLLNLMKNHIKTLSNALAGKISMSEEMDKIATALYNNQVPQVWIKYGFLSLKPLKSWLEDLNNRVSFFENWIKNGTPTSFCLSRFSFPQAFLTGTLQNYARKYQKAIDLLSFKFSVLDMLSPERITEKPEDGCYVYGMYLEGARWNYNSHQMDTSRNRELYSDVPLIHMLPVADREIPEGVYQCPLYKVLTRQGTLSTTGHSTNFVLMVELPTSSDESVWIKSGAAMFLALKQ